MTAGTAVEARRAHRVSGRIVMNYLVISSVVPNCEAQVGARVVLRVALPLHVPEMNGRVPERERPPVPGAPEEREAVERLPATNARTVVRWSGAEKSTAAGATATIESTSSGSSTWVWESCR